MSDEEVIAKQARTIANLEESLTSLREAVEDVKMMMVCIGGPLNDNVLEFTSDQRKLIFRMFYALGGE